MLRGAPPTWDELQKGRGEPPTWDELQAKKTEEKPSFQAQHPFISELANIAGGLQGGISQGVADLLNIPHAVYGKIPAFGDVGVSPVLKGIADTGSASYNLPRSITELMPALIGGEGAAAKLIPAAKNTISQLAKTALAGGITGFGGTEGNLSDRAENAAIGSAIGPAIAGGGRAANALKTLYQEGPRSTKGAINTLMNVLNPKLIDKTVSNFRNEIGGGLDRQGLNEINNSAIIGNYNKQKEIGSNLYKRLYEEGDKLDYNPVTTKLTTQQGSLYTGVPTKTQTSTQGKRIIFSPASRDALKKVQMSQRNKELENPSDNVINAIRAVKQSASIRNVHQLQSELQKEASYFDKYDTMQRNTKNLYSSLGKNLINDMHTTFIKNGDTHLSDLLNEAQKHWRENVVPYQEAPQIRQLISTGEHRPNILKTLEKSDDDGNMDTIRSHIESNPVQQKSLLAQALSNKLRLADRGKKTTLTHVEEAYNRLPDVLHELTESPATNELMDILNKNKTYKTLRKGGLGAATLVGGNELFKMFGIHPMSIL